MSAGTRRVGLNRPGAMGGSDGAASEAGRVVRFFRFAMAPVYATQWFVIIGGIG